LKVLDFKVLNASNFYQIDFDEIKRKDDEVSCHFSTDT